MIRPKQHRADLRQQLLVAALSASGGDIRQQISFEELLVEAWKGDPLSWGLRGFEQMYPDSERIHRELDSRGKNQQGLVGLGLLDKVRPRVYRLTAKGLAEASEAAPETSNALAKLDRTLEAEVKKIVEHPVFIEWLTNNDHPTRFREAGYFWGIAPGTPPRVIQERIRNVDDTLNTAMRLLDRRGVEQFGEGRRAILYERQDIERCLAFHETIRDRFHKDLKMLGVEF